MIALKAFLRTFTPTSIALVVTLVVALFVLGWCAVTAPGRKADQIDTAISEANGAVRDVAAGASEASANDRLNDSQSNADLKEDLTHAVESLPDARPSDRRHALACERLRHDPNSDQAAVARYCGPPG